MPTDSMNRRLALLSCVATVVCVASAIALRGFEPEAEIARLIGVGLYFIAALAVVVLGVSLGLWGVSWWMRQDEVIKEAHKSAWIWGAPIGFGVWIVTLLTPAPEAAAAVLDIDAIELGLNLDYLAGGLVAFAAMVLAYWILLAVWWIAKR
ncbi:MAG: hypothetical protein PVI23_13060 [Maricaulaceae bacterium]